MKLKFRPKFLTIAILQMAASSAAIAEENTGVSVIPRLLFSGSVLTGTYAEKSYSEIKNQEARLDDVKLSGSDSRLSMSFDQFYGLEINYRALKPKDVSYWSQRNEISAFASIYIPEIDWIQPAIGYFEVQQVGDNTDSAAPPAFIRKNNGLSIGARTRFNLYKMGGTGFMTHARIDYLTSLEAKNNFGLEYTYGIGYYAKWDSVAFNIIGGLTRNEFKAGKSDPEDTGGNLGLEGTPAMLKVDHRYQVFKLGVEISY